VVALLSLFSLYASSDHRVLHSFPTRRSSDLGSDKLIRQTVDVDTVLRVVGNVHRRNNARSVPRVVVTVAVLVTRIADGAVTSLRSEEHTSELQSRENLVCRLLLEKKKKTKQ